MTSRQIPSSWTVCTTGYAAPCPLGDRATSTASSRSNATYSSTSRPIPWAITSAAELSFSQIQMPLPS